MSSPFRLIPAEKGSFFVTDAISKEIVGEVRELVALGADWNPEPGSVWNGVTNDFSCGYHCREDAAQAVYQHAKAFERITELAPNWDGYDGVPPTRAAISTAHAVANALLHPPQVVPVNDGGVQLEWHIEGVDVEIAITPKGEVEVEDTDLASHMATKHPGFGE